MRGGFTGPPDFVILAGGSKNKDEKVFKVDIPLIKKLREKSIPLIGVEASQIEHSYMEYYQKQGISTVDNVDTIIGQISLALIMTGQEGNYGIKEGRRSCLYYSRRNQMKISVLIPAYNEAEYRRDY